MATKSVLISILIIGALFGAVGMHAIEYSDKEPLHNLSSANNSYRYFSSESEFMDWIKIDTLDRRHYINNTFDCENFAMELQNRALDDGLILSCQLMDEVTGEVTGGESNHVVITAFIPKENVIVVFEPQDDKILKRIKMDGEI